MTRHRLLITAAATGCFALAFQGLAAAEQGAKQPVEQLLDVGWGQSFRSLKPAAEHYEAAKAAAPRDPRVHYAFALVQIKHRKYDDAKKLLDEALALDEDHLRAWRTKIWIDTLLKRYSAALVQAEQLSKRLSKQPANDEDRAEQRETARFLGRIFAFLEGPVEKASRAEQVADAKGRVVKGLSQSDQKEFEAGRQAVADRFAELYLVREQKKDEAQEQQAKTKEKEAQRLAEEKNAVGEGKKAVQERAMQTREELDKLLSKIEQEIVPLDRELGRLSSAAAGVRDQIILLDRQIDRALALANSTEDPNLALRYQLDADRSNAIRARYAAQYRSIEAQAARVGGERAALLRQRNGAIARYNEEAKRLGKEQVKLRRNEKRLAREEEKNGRPASGNTPRITALSRKVFAFTTYEPFPLEQEKARVLESYK